MSAVLTHTVADYAPKELVAFVAADNRPCHEGHILDCGV